MMENPKPFGILTDRNDKEVGISFFQPSSHGQYKYEGFVYASACCILGLLFLLAFKVPKLTEDKVMQKLYLFVILSGIICIWMFLEWICATKYQPTPGFYPPHYYMKGSLMLNQGFNIL